MNALRLISLCLGRRSVMLAALAFAFLVISAPAAEAARQPMSIDQCVAFYGGSGFQPWEYTTKVVFCIRGAIMQATFMMLAVMSDYLRTFIGGLMTLATIIFGIRIASGERELVAKAAGFIFRLALIGIFSLNLGGFTGLAFGGLDELIVLVTGGYSPFQQIDKILGKLIGFGPTLVLSQGLLGLISASFFSSSVGFTVFSSGIFGFINLLVFIYNVVFTYLKALIVIGFLLILSPLVIPFGVFFYTERYMKKWLDILFSAILLPVLMFAFLFMFLSIFNILVTNIFEILGAKCQTPGDFDSCPSPNFSSMWKLMQPMFSWLMPGDPNMAYDLQGHGISGYGSDSIIRNIEPVQSNVNPLLNKGMNANTMNLPGIDFGPNTIYITQQLTFALLSIWFFATMMKNMLNKIPSIANSIASATSGLVIETSGLREKSREMTGNLKAGAGAIVGGSAGGALGGAVSRAGYGGRGGSGQRTGGVLGAFGGAILGSKKL